jgi:Ca2+/Na+ antiporter
MDRYHLVLRNDKLRQYDRFAVFILILNLLIFLYLFIVITETPGRIIFLLGTLLLIATVIFTLYLLKHNNEKVANVL